MNIYVLNDKWRVEVSFITFSDGSEICEIGRNEHLTLSNATIVLNVTDSNKDIIRLMLVKDALDHIAEGDIKLSLPYIPNARADRRFKRNQSHSLKVFCNIINSMNFKQVYVSDPHSDVPTALINNAVVNDQMSCYSSMSSLINKECSDYLLCSPDIGATKKTFDIAKYCNKEFIQAVKIRDVSTGEIVKCDVQCEDLNGQNIMIVDDIADGGASFIYLSKKLKEKGAGKIMLYVTHGIFSKGLEPFVGKIDKIFVYNLMEEYINDRELQLFNQ